MNQKVIAIAGATLLFILGCLIPQSHSLAKDLFPPSFSSQELISQMPKTDSTDKLIAAQKQFGFKLFSQLWQGQKNQNIFVSPSSIAIALSMVNNGANGETAKAIAQGLQLENMSLEEINEANKALVSTATGLIVAITSLAFYRLFQAFWFNQVRIFRKAGSQLELIYRQRFLDFEEQE